MLIAAMYIKWYGVHIFHLILFARMPSDVTDFNARNKILTATTELSVPLFSKSFFQIYRRHYELYSKCKIGKFFCNRHIGTRILW